MSRAFAKEADAVDDDPFREDGPDDVPPAGRRGSRALAARMGIA